MKKLIPQTVVKTISPNGWILGFNQTMQGCSSALEKKNQWKTITLNGKDYPQAWYHYEEWKNGERVVKKSKYIPKRLLTRIQELEAEKVPVKEILKLLRVKL